jgi:hypothetical protein
VDKVNKAETIYTRARGERRFCGLETAHQTEGEEYDI